MASAALDRESLDGLSPELRAVVEEAHDRAAAAGYAVEEPEPPEETRWPEGVADDPPPSEATIACVYCGCEIASPRSAYRRVQAWERKRRAGGTNAVRLREPLDEYACAPCVDALAAGRPIGQAAIL